MNETTRPSRDYAQQLADIERAIAETRKYGEETKNFTAEQNKLNAEALKLERERSLAPIVIPSSVLSFILGGTVVALITHFLR